MRQLTAPAAATLDPLASAGPSVVVGDGEGERVVVGEGEGEGGDGDGDEPPGHLVAASAACTHVADSTIAPFTQRVVPLGQEPSLHFFGVHCQPDSSLAVPAQTEPATPVPLAGAAGTEQDEAAAA